MSAQDMPYALLIFSGLSFMLFQLAANRKRSEHILFALFCGSLAMVGAEYFSARAIGSFSLLVGFFTCATCNVMWLISRALFRENTEQAIALRHILVAVFIALLTIANKSVAFASSGEVINAQSFDWMARSLGAVTQFLSSTILALSVWEALRGFSQANQAGKAQRIVFASSFGAGVFACMVVADGMLPPQYYDAVFPWLMLGSAMGIMFAVQYVMFNQSRRNLRTSDITEPTRVPNTSSNVINLDKDVISGIEQLFTNEKIYLNGDIKMIDIATKLSVPEYKVSRVIRHHYQAPNFNHFINQYRIEHAKYLLSQPESMQWTLLVIALESGFASVGTFNRAFKANEGVMPSAYRNNQRLNMVSTS